LITNAIASGAYIAQTPTAKLPIPFGADYFQPSVSVSISPLQSLG